MNAKKCDRCGAYYDHYRNRKSKPYANGIQFIDKEAAGAVHRMDLLDLCPKCMEELTGFFHAVTIDSNLNVPNEKAREHILEPGTVVKHFKHDLTTGDDNRYTYSVIGQASYTEAEEEFVVYRARYGDHAVYCRPKNMFLSEVDHAKYPDAKQKYRMEKIGNVYEGDSLGGPECIQQQTFSCREGK